MLWKPFQKSQKMPFLAAILTLKIRRELIYDSNFMCDMSLKFFWPLVFNKNILTPTRWIWVLVNSRSKWSNYGSPKTSGDFQELPETDVFIRFLSKTLFKTFQMILCNLGTFGLVRQISVNFGQIWSTLVKLEFLEPLGASSSWRFWPIFF